MHALVPCIIIATQSTWAIILPQSVNAHFGSPLIGVGTPGIIGVLLTFSFLFLTHRLTARFRFGVEHLAFSYQFLVSFVSQL